MAPIKAIARWPKTLPRPEVGLAEVREERDATFEALPTSGSQKITPEGRAGFTLDKVQWLDTLATTA